MTTTTAGERFAPELGDIVWVDLDPVRGSEQAGNRPALVISETILNRTSHSSIVCPITSNVGDWPTKVLLPKECPIRGAVLVEHVRSLDHRQRGFRFICKAPTTVIVEVRTLLASILGIEPGRLSLTP